MTIKPYLIIALMGLSYGFLFTIGTRGVYFLQTLWVLAGLSVALSCFTAVIYMPKEKYQPKWFKNLKRS